MDKPLILENLDTKFYSKIEDAISYLERKQQFYGDSSSQKAEEIAEIIKDFDATFYALQKTFTPSDIEKIEKKALIKIKQSQKQKPVFLGRQLDKKISDAKDILESLKDSIAEQPITPIAVTPSNSKIASDNAKNTFEGAIRDFITAKPTDLPRVNDRTDYRNKGAFYLLSYGPRNQITSRLIFNSGKNNYSATIQNGEVQIYQVNLDSPATTETAIDKNSESYLSVLKNINQTIANYHGNKRREAIQQQEEASAHNPPGYIQRIRRLPRIERDQMIAEQARLEQMTSRTTTSDLPPPYQPTSGRDQPPSYAFVESQANQPRQTPPSNSATTRSVSPLAQGSGREGGGERED